MVTPRPRRHAAGFTLIEALIVLAIIGVLAAVGIPSFSQMIANQRTKSIASDLFTSLVRARSEAIKRNTEITIRPTGNWVSGWTIPDPADSAAQIDVHGASANAVITGPGSVIFTPNGRSKAAATFEVGVVNRSERRCVIIDLSGRPYQKNSAC